jgi:DNA sulfur modification protein DndB
MIRDLEHIIKNGFSQKLQSKYGDKWRTAGMPPKVYRQANDKMGKLNYEYSVTGNGQTVSIWDCVSLSNCREIAIFGPNWSELFEDNLTRPEERKVAGGKSKKIEWLARLAKIESSSNPTTSISEDDYNFIQSLYNWLIQQ